jgi:hypothetical protein
MADEKVRMSLREWISLDDEERRHKEAIKQIKIKKDQNSADILAFMRDNSVDNFSLEGNGMGNISRSVRTTRPGLKRTVIRTQLLLQFADQPQRVAEVLRQIEGIPEGAEDMSAGGIVRESLVRRIPKTKMTVSV